MASRAETLARCRAKRAADAEDAIDADGSLDVDTSGTRRHMRDKLMGEIMLEDAQRRAGRAAGEQVQGSAEETRRLIAGLEASVRPSARQRFVEATFVDGAGDLLPAAIQACLPPWGQALRQHSSATAYVPVRLRRGHVHGAWASGGRSRQRACRPGLLSSCSR
jgi:hypothetical protein